MMAWPNIWAQRMNPVSFPQMGIPQHPMLPAQSMMRYPFGGGAQPMPIMQAPFSQNGPQQPQAFANPFLRRML